LFEFYEKAAFLVIHRLDCLKSGLSVSCREPLPHGHSAQRGFLILTKGGVWRPDSAILEIQFLRIDEHWLNG